MWTEEEFDTELYDYQGWYIGRWHMGYSPEWNRVISLYSLDEESTEHQKGGNTEWRQP